MNAVRVLWLTKGLGRGGAEMLLVGLARAMDRSGIEIEVAYQLSRKTALVEALHVSGIAVHLLDGDRTWPVALRRLMKAQHYDIVHSHAPMVGSAARILAPRGTVLLHTEHNTWDRYHPATRLVNALTLVRNERVWAVSDQVAKSIRPWPRRRPPVEVMLHGVSEATVVRGGAARVAARARLGMSETTFVFGTVGNLARKKDHPTLLRAFARVSETLPAVQLLVIGTGPEEAELRALAHRLHLDRKVRFLGMREDVLELLPALDTFVMSSVHEGLSIAIIEALATGVPVVSTDVGGIPQLITHGEHGLLVPPRNVVALERAMLRMALDESERTRLGVAGRRRASDFGIEPAAAALGAHYRRLMSERRQEVPAG